MEIAEPSIKEAVNQCAQNGYQEVIVAPYFLSQGRHIQQDIPALVAEAEAAHPGLNCIIAEPIGESRKFLCTGLVQKICSSMRLFIPNLPVSARR